MPESSSSKQLKTRLLSSDEWYKLGAFKHEFGGSLPKPQQADVVVVEDGDMIVGILTLEKMIHIGPMWTHPKYRASGVLAMLIKAGVQHFPTELRGGVLFSKHPKIKKLAAMFGLLPVDMPAYKWEE